MLLRLSPHPPHPTIIFSLAFHSLPQELPFPIGWATQYNSTLSEGLDIPPDAHALDKSGWAISLLEKVNFDLVRMKVQCTFLDGVTIDEFDIPKGCEERLMTVLEDVRLAGVEAAKEQRKADKNVESQEPISPLIPRPRSPLPQFGSPSPSPTPFPAPESSIPLNSRFLRRRARSTLVDVWRTYAYTPLAKKYTSIKGGFQNWCAEHMLRRAEKKKLVIEMRMAREKKKEEEEEVKKATEKDVVAKDEEMKDGAGATVEPTAFSNSGDVDEAMSTASNTVDEDTPASSQLSITTTVLSSSSSTFSVSSSSLPLSTQHSAILARINHLHNVLTRLTQEYESTLSESTRQSEIKESKALRRSWSSGSKAAANAAKPLRSSPLSKHSTSMSMLGVGEERMEEIINSESPLSRLTDPEFFYLSILPNGEKKEKTGEDEAMEEDSDDEEMGEQEEREWRHSQRGRRLLRPQSTPIQSSRGLSRKAHVRATQRSHKSAPASMLPSLDSRVMICT